MRRLNIYRIAYMAIYLLLGYLYIPGALDLLLAELEPITVDLYILPSIDIAPVVKLMLLLGVGFFIIGFLAMRTDIAVLSVFLTHLLSSKPYPRTG
jgi:hypothetical protein